MPLSNVEIFPGQLIFLPPEHHDPCPFGNIGCFFNYVKDKRCPVSLASFIRFFKVIITAIVCHRRLKLSDTRRARQRWKIVGWSVGPALVGQADKNQPLPARSL